MYNEQQIVLETKQLSIGYDRSKPLVSDLTVQLQKSKLVGLVARNGSGKSTFIKTLSGVLKPISGNIFLQGKSVADFSKKELSKKISIVLTDKPNLFGFTVWNLVSLGRFPYLDLFGNLSREDEKIVLEAIELCDIEHLSKKYCNQLSDGEFQKAMLARALAQQTELMLLDEPSSFLDYPAKLNLMFTLKKLAIEKNMTFLIASHDLDLLKEFTHELIIFRKNSYEIISSENISVKELNEMLVD